jgi:hypothetical protein
MLPNGTKVLTTKDAGAKDWEKAAREHVTWHTPGVILAYSDSHGLVYKVLHGYTIAWYESEELNIL